MSIAPDYQNRSITTRFMDITIRIAVLLTCHNRRDKTINCLKALYSQNLPDQVQLLVYLVDDGSTDGTSDTVKQLFPQVHLLSGNGQLFWNGGMRIAFAKAMESSYDYYLWLNDDTTLYPKCIEILLSTAQKLSEHGYEKTIVIGSTCDPQSKELTYGGVVRKNWWHPFQFKPQNPIDKPVECDTMNGNCVLIHHSVVNTVGNLDPAFTHATGDFDYGLRAKRQGCTIWVAPGFLGSCARTPFQGSMSTDIPVQKRLKMMQSPKEFSLLERKVFAQRYGGLLWPIFWLLPFRKWIFPFKKGNL